MSSSEVYAKRADRPRRRRVIRDAPSDVAAAATRLRRLPRELPTTGPGGAFLRGLVDVVRQLEPQGSCPGGRHCTCPPAPVHGCCLLHFPDDPCDDCPAAHPELEQHCADCGIGETEEALIVRPRHGGDVLLCEECDRDARALVPEEYRDDA